MHVIGMDHVDRRRDDAVAMHASLRRECRESLEAEGALQGRRGGGRCGADDEPQPEP